MHRHSNILSRITPATQQIIDGEGHQDVAQDDKEFVDVSALCREPQCSDSSLLLLLMNDSYINAVMIDAVDESLNLIARVSGNHEGGVNRCALK